MKTQALLVIILFVRSWAPSPLAADEAAVKEFLWSYVEAFNRQDLEATSAMWAEDCSHFDRESGEETRGRVAIREDLAALFESPVRTHLSGEILRIRVIQPDVVRIEGTTKTSVPDEAPVISSFTGIVVKEGEKWLIDSIEETPETSILSATTALQELAWLEGTWQDASDGHRVVSTIRWSPTRTFLIRSISEEHEQEVEQKGTEIIGWDPRSQQIRSWTFHADGSFGDGVWTKADEDWLIKSSQTLADGDAASGTYVLSRVDESTVSLQLVGHEIEGALQPTTEKILATRVLDSPDAAKPATEGSTEDATVPRE